MYRMWSVALQSARQIKPGRKLVSQENYDGCTRDRMQRKLEKVLTRDGKGLEDGKGTCWEIISVQ